QLLKAIEKEQILEKYIAFEQSHGQFFSALDELIRATGQAVQELLDKVTFNDQTGTYSIPQSTTASLQRMKKALDTARTENDKDPYPESFEDYTLLAYTYVNDRGETVTMWLLEKDGKRANNKELQAFLEEHGNDLNPVLYTELSGEELERKVNDAWKDGVNYLNGQKVSGPSAGILKTSAYAASMKDAMDDAGLTEMTMSLGFGIAAARNKAIISKKTREPETNRVDTNQRERILKNIEESKKAREASNFKDYIKREKEILEEIKQSSGSRTQGKDIFNYTDIVNAHMNNPDRAIPAMTLKEAIKGGTPLPDPRGSRATMYYSEIYINEKKYNFEVLYDQKTNTIYHFKYGRRPLGPLPAVPK
ncbi:hypothetical protein, partial [Listeria seeligeri]